MRKKIYSCIYEKYTHNFFKVQRNLQLRKHQDKFEEIGALWWEVLVTSGRTFEQCSSRSEQLRAQCKVGGDFEVWNHSKRDSDTWASRESFSSHSDVLLTLQVVPAHLKAVMRIHPWVIHFTVCERWERWEQGGWHLTLEDRVF